LVVADIEKGTPHASPFQRV